MQYFESFNLQVNKRVNQLYDLIAMFHFNLGAITRQEVAQMQGQTQEQMQMQLVTLCSVSTTFFCVFQVIWRLNQLNCFHIR